MNRQVFHLLLLLPHDDLVCFCLCRNNVGRGEDEIAAVLRLLHLLHLSFLSLVLTFASLPLPRQLAIRSKDVRNVRQGSDKSSEIERLATAGVAAETAASGLAGTAAGSAAAALVGEGDNYGEDEAKDGAGKAKIEVEASTTAILQWCSVNGGRNKWQGEEISKDSSDGETDIDCCRFW